MNILLVQAAWVTDDWPEIPTMPLGLLSLAAVVREEFGEQVTCSLLDLTLKKADPEQELTETLVRLRPDVVGIRALTHQHAGILRFSELAKELAPHAKIVVGGPHATTHPSSLLTHEAIDCVVVGEGEETFRELIGAWLREEEAFDVAGTAWRRDGKISFAPARPLVADLDRLPLPAFDLLDFPAYHAKPSMTQFRAGKYANVFTSRGCPYGCTYCHRIFGKKVRLRSVASIMAELSVLMNEHGIDELHIIDDIFNINKRRVLEFADAIVRLDQPIRLAFPNGLRADLVDAQVVEALSAAGTYFTRYAIETASPAHQKSIGKNLDIERAYDAIEMTAAKGIFVGICNMLGFIGETEEEMNETVERACRSSAIFCHFFRVTPFPGTKLFADAVECGLVPRASPDLLDSLRFKTNDHVSLSPVPAPEISNIRREAIKRFSFSKKRLALYQQAVPALFSRAERAAYVRRKLRESELALDEIADPAIRESLAEMLMLSRPTRDSLGTACAQSR